MARFSVRDGRWINRRRRSASSVSDPYATNSADYAERNRATETEMPNGLIRIDIGEPIV